MGELFSGPGGMSFGAHLAASDSNAVSLVHAWANDIDPDACATFVNNVPGASSQTVQCEDVRNLDIRNLGPIDGLAFGFPCNDFSLVGTSTGVDGKFGLLYKYGVHALDAHRPLWFVAENVSGLRSANDGRAFEMVLEDLERAGGTGYDLYPHMYNFDAYGVPQTRKRIIIVGIRKDQALRFEVPSPEMFKGENVSVEYALTVPPMSDSLPDHARTRHSKAVIERLRHIRPGENAFSADLPGHLRLNVKGATISQIYRRLKAELPSYTITGSGGGGTHVYHWSEDRALTNRERARIQTFPDSYSFVGNKESVRKQIGMAVPVRGARAIFKALFDTFAGIAYESVGANIPCRTNLERVK